MVRGGSEAINPFSCGSLGHSAPGNCSGMAAPFFPSKRSTLKAAYLDVKRLQRSVVVPQLSDEHGVIVSSANDTMLSIDSA
mgnify:FL=1